MSKRTSQYDEKGFRTVDQNIVDNAPTFWFVFSTALCPGCGACYNDIQSSKGQEPPPKAPEVESKDDITKKLKPYVSGGDASWPNVKVECQAPVQMKMDGKAIPAPMQPDITCTCLSICCCWRAAAVGFVFMIAAPGMLAAKYGLGMFAAGTICFCLCISFFLRLVAFCFPKLFNMNTPSMRTIFVNVVDMKRVDAMEVLEAGEGITDKPCMKLNQVGRQLLALLQGFCCCEFFRPSRVFTFAKILIAMLFTEIGMVVSAYFYMVGRFACGSSTWTLGSFLGWIREYLNSLSLKSRVVQMKYDAWGWDKAGKASPQKEGAPNCGAQCIEVCCTLPCCKLCGCDFCCTFCCDICGPLCCGFCDLGMEIFGELASAVLLVGKALYYTKRIFDPNQANNGGNGETVGKDRA